MSSQTAVPVLYLGCEMAMVSCWGLKTNWRGIDVKAYTYGPD